MRATFAVKGMHCPACERLVSDALVEEGLAREAAASLARHEVTVEGAVDGGAWLARARAALEPLGYRLLAPGEPDRGRLREALTGLVLASAVLGLFLLLQASGLVPLFTPTRLDAGGAVALGVVASLSSCFALVGGLLVTYTSSLAAADQSRAWAGQALFHAARLAAFVVLGGALGGLGSAFRLDLGWTQALQGIAALVMVLLGLRLTGAFALMSRWGRSAGGSAAGRGGIAGWARRRAASAGVPGGALLGVASFFLPCGFTQSMQFQALASGSIASGALLMGLFSVGTLPVLAGLSTALVKGFRGRAHGLLATAAGFLVLGLGIYQAVSLLTALGLLRP